MTDQAARLTHFQLFGDHSAVARFSDNTAVTVGPHIGKEENRDGEIRAWALYFGHDRRRMGEVVERNTTLQSFLALLAYLEGA